jgi:hypothetical protein
MSGDPLTMSYFDNLNNESLNKYKKNLKNGHSNFMQFHYRLIVHQKSLNWNRCKLYENLMVFNKLQMIIKLHEI